MVCQGNQDPPGLKDLKDKKYFFILCVPTFFITIVVASNKKCISILLLQGMEGPRGETGPIGPSGEKGATGPQGPVGYPGTQGEKGDKGASGRRGRRGSKGVMVFK